MSSVIRGNDNFDSLIHQGIGVNQTWQDVTASRASGVTYTNTTGKPIVVIISTSGSGTAQDNTLSVNGTVFAKAFAASGAVHELSVIVPNGSTYILTTSSAPYRWAELR